MLLLALSALQVSSKAPVVDIFYESQCPDSLEFLNTTLRQAFEDKQLWNSMELKLHPFGNARVYPESIISEGYHFWHPEATYPHFMCQHGEAECMGNRIQACAIALHPKSEEHVPFIICMASYGLGAGTELTSFACGKKLGMDMQALKKCANGDEGSEDRSHDLMMSIGATTMVNRIRGAPTVMVNDVQTVNNTLTDPVCNAIHGDKPRACTTRNGGKPEEAKGDCGGSGAGFLARREAPCGNAIAIRVPAPYTTAIKELM